MAKYRISNVDCLTSQIFCLHNNCLFLKYEIPVVSCALYKTKWLRFLKYKNLLSSEKSESVTNLSRVSTDLKTLWPSKQNSRAIICCIVGSHGDLWHVPPCMNRSALSVTNYLVGCMLSILIFPKRIVWCQIIRFRKTFEQPARSYYFQPSEKCRVICGYTTRNAWLEPALAEIRPNLLSFATVIEFTSLLAWYVPWVSMLAE